MQEAVDDPDSDRDLSASTCFVELVVLMIGFSLTGYVLVSGLLSPDLETALT